MTDGLLGSMSLHRIDHDQRTAEIGYWTTPDARSRTSPRPPSWRCAGGFATLSLERIELMHAVENEASARIAEKAGFTLEGRMRRVRRRRQRHDELLWARLRDDPPQKLTPFGTP